MISELFLLDLQQREREKYNFDNAKQSSIVKSLSGKTRITIRIDTDILNWFREQVHKIGFVKIS